VASLSQGRTAAAQCGLFTHKSVPVIFEPPCMFDLMITWLKWERAETRCQLSDILHNNNKQLLCLTYIISYFDTYYRTHNGDESPKVYREFIWFCI